jgi:hypothetical protein
MQVTKDQVDAQAADYADEFGQPDKQRTEQSEDQAFGLDEPAAEAAADAPADAAPVDAPAEAAEAGVDAASDAPHGEQPTGGAEEGGEAAAAPVDQEQRLKSWEGRLKARQAELDAREAAMGTTNVDAEETSEPADAAGDAPAELDAGADANAGEDAGVDADPASVLAEDFGQDFVAQITKLIKSITQESVGGVSATVDQVIQDLQNERLQNHFSAIAGTHGDFMEVVESPEFEAWKAAQPDQERLQAVIASGSARQIIDMLTSFKAGKQEPASAEAEAAPEADPFHEDALDAAEGVRSSGLTLPTEPTASDDFAKAWNEA